LEEKVTFIDLFAGCGGLSEGFVQAGFSPLAHVEKDKSACYSLKTRMAFLHLSKVDKTQIYSNYLYGKINRDTLYGSVPKSILDSVINAEIGSKTLPNIFMRIDAILDGGKPDLIVGGPPCQAYSLIGRAAKARGNGMHGDERNWLFKFYIEFLKRYSPKHFVFENVTGLFSAKDKYGTRYFDIMMEDFCAAGYTVPETPVISADKHGVPQKRQRIIIVGTRSDLKPIRLHLTEKEPKTKVERIFEDLPPIMAGDKSYGTVEHGRGCAVLRDLGIESNFPITLHKARPHNARDLEIYRIAVQKWNCNGERLNYNDVPAELQTHKNRTAFTDRFKVVAGNLPSSHTIVAHLSKDGHYYIHYDIEQNRSISPREAARLQTFPDEYYFESADGRECLSNVFKQIGNAVPVYLAKQIAESIRVDMENGRG
jgi:DNA (cytosine-5)-methyltransferase 1